jgi:hypothetical protein
MAGDVRKRRGRLMGNPGKVMCQSKFECPRPPIKNPCEDRLKILGKSKNAPIRLNIL